MPIEITDIKKIKIDKNEVLLLTMPERLWANEIWIKEIETMFSRLFPGVTTLISPDIIKFSIISKEDAIITRALLKLKSRKNK